MSEKPEADPLPFSIDAHGRVVVAVRVIPRAPRTAVNGLRGGALLVRLAAPPVEGAANDALLVFLSHLFDCPKARLELIAGDTSRNKRVAIAGIDLDAAARRLRATL